MPVKDLIISNLSLTFSFLISEIIDLIRFLISFLIKSTNISTNNANFEGRLITSDLKFLTKSKKGVFYYQHHHLKTLTLQIMVIKLWDKTVITKV